VNSDHRISFMTTSALSTTSPRSSMKRAPCQSRPSTAAWATFGEQQMVELVAAVGFYVMVGMTLNAFDAAVPGAVEPFA
jgi:hypothetical protein